MIKKLKILSVIMLLIMQIAPVYTNAEEFDDIETDWEAKFFNNENFEGSPIEKTYPTLNFDWGSKKPFETDSFSAIFTKKFVVDENLNYSLQGDLNGEIEIFVNDENIFLSEDNNGKINERVQFEKGENNIEVKYKGNRPNPKIFLEILLSEVEEREGKFPSEDLSTQKWLAISYKDPQFIDEIERATIEKVDLELFNENEFVNKEQNFIFAKKIDVSEDTVFLLSGEVQGKYRLYIDDELVYEKNKIEKLQINEEILIGTGVHQVIVEMTEIDTERLFINFSFEENLKDVIDSEQNNLLEKEETIYSEENSETVESTNKEEKEPVEIKQKEVANEESNAEMSDKVEVPSTVETPNIVRSQMTMSTAVATYSSTNNWLASFYPNPNFTGKVVNKEYSKLDLSWGTGSPDQSIPNDNFSAKFTREITVNKNEFYRIHGRADDGIRIFIDDKLVVDQWKDGVNQFHKDLLLTAGKHNIRVEYYEGKYSAAIRVNIDPISTLVGSEWEAAYYNNDNFQSMPIVTKVETLDLNWGSGSPMKGISKDYFTATFQKNLNVQDTGEYIFSGRADDGIRIYVDDKLVVNEWKEGVNRYNQKVKLNKGNHLIRVEYIEKKYSAAISLDITSAVPDTDTWKATYYPTKNFTGISYVTTHKNLDLNWGSGSPAPGIPVDNFSATFEKTIDVKEESDYLFTGRGDDGVRVYVDGKKIVDKWGVGVNNFETTIKLTKGKHTIKVDYYDQKYSAAIRVEYLPIPKTAQNDWLAKYYPTKNFTGTPIMKNIGQNINLNWGTGSPAKEIPNDEFSAIFEKVITVSKEGMYHFTGRADDGYRVYVDGKLVINGWATGVNQINHLVNLSAGTHTIRVEYFDEKYSAAISLDMKQVSSQPNQWLASYYPSKNMTGLVVKRYEGTNLDLNWGSGSPATSIPVDNFSATFEKTINIPKTGTYQIVGRADDGIRVYVDGKKVIEKWQSGVNQFNQNIHLAAGNHKIKIEYFEEKYGAAIKLDVKEAEKQESYKTTVYTSTYKDVLAKQMGTNPPPQTDLYGTKNGFVHKNDVTISKAAVINGSGVRLRTSPEIKGNNIYGTVLNGTSIQYIKDVTGTSVSGSTKWYEINYQNRTLYVHSSLASLNASVAKTNKKTPVRETANGNSHIYGHLDQGATVNLVKEGATWHEVKYVTWRNAKQADVERYLNPNNFKQGTKDYYQFLSLKGSSNINITEVNQKILAGKGVLAGKASAFDQAAKTHNINEMYLISHSLLETGNGDSALAKGVLVSKVDGKSVTPRIVYNMYGIGAYDSCALQCGSEYAYKQGWFTVDAAIIGGAKFIGQNYVHAGQDTLYKMKWNPANPGTHQYATDIGWAVKQTTRLHQFYSQLDVYSITFDIPKYK